VSSPAGTLMKSGEACWVFSQGSSDYQGPLDVQLQHGRGLIFDHTGSVTLSLRNHSTVPVDVSLHTVQGEAELPVSFRIRFLGDKEMKNATAPLPVTLRLGNIEPAETKGLQFEVRREEMTGTVQRTLLKISTDLGVHYWIPMVANRSDPLPNE